MPMCPIFAFLILGSYPLTFFASLSCIYAGNSGIAKWDKQKNTRLSPLSTTSLCMCLSVFQVFGDYYVLFPVIASWSSFRLSLLPLLFPHASIHSSIHPYGLIHPCIPWSIHACVHPRLSIHIYWSIYASICPSIYRVFLCPSTHACIHLSIHPCMYSSIYLSIHVYPCSQLASGTESSWPKASRYHCIPYVMGGGWELCIHIRVVTAPAANRITLPYLKLKKNEEK